MTERRQEPTHWLRIKKLFGFKDCRETTARVAAEWLDVEDPTMLRATYDINLSSASLHKLDTLMLAAADALVADREKALEEARALRHEMWIAEQNSERHFCAVDIAIFTSPTTGERVEYDLLPHELMLKDLLESEYA